MSERKKLDPEFKAKWVAALRSGDWKQCRGRLFDGKDGYCCLGVAEKLLRPEAQLSTGSWPALSDDLVALLSFERRCQLADMNDGDSGDRQHTFAEIADYIEANL